MVTIEKLLMDGINIIKNRDYNNPNLDVQIILSHILSKDKIYLHMHRNHEVTDDIADKFYEMVRKRNEGYPLQYMTNSQEFMGLDFYVQDGVLVPRPDTEILVEKIIKIAGKYENKINILDIGTGSGAIAVSLGYYLKNSMVTAVDISDTALKTAEINIKKHSLNNVKLFKADIFNYEFGDEKYDIVVSNPPYIESDIIKELPVEVSTYEPKLALDGGEDGLNYYKQIVKVFKKICKYDSILAVEIGYNQKETVTEIFKNSNLFKRIECEKDYGGNDRVIIGYLERGK